MKGDDSTAGTLATLMTAIGSVFTWVMTSIADVAQLFVETPILQLGLAMMVIGFLVALLSRLVNIR